MENKEIIKENKEIAEIFNNYFVNIVKDLNIPEINHSNISGSSNNSTAEPIEIIIQNFSEHPSIIKIKEHITQTELFSFKLLNEIDIESEIKLLNSKKAPGVDGIPTRILKEAVDILKYPLAQLFNVSIENHFFPNDLKFANVTPIFKKDENINKENYRPISILPSISKIFERSMFKQITIFIEHKVSQYLCGFRKGYNTQHALLRLMDKLNRSLDKKEKIKQRRPYVHSNL